MCGALAVCVCCRLLYVLWCCCMVCLTCDVMLMIVVLVSYYMCVLFWSVFRYCDVCVWMCYACYMLLISLYVCIVVCFTVCFACSLDSSICCCVTAYVPLYVCCVLGCLHYMLWCYIVVTVHYVAVGVLFVCIFNCVLYVM